MAKKKPVVSKYGQWKYPGQETIIPNANGSITMQGVPYPVLGIDDLGNQQMMMPGMDYQFPGNSVYEIPMAKMGGAKKVKIHSLPKAQRGSATFQDSLDVANSAQQVIDWYNSQGYYGQSGVGDKEPARSRDGVKMIPLDKVKGTKSTTLNVGGKQTLIKSDDLGQGGLSFELPEFEVELPSLGEAGAMALAGTLNAIGGIQNLTNESRAEWESPYRFRQYADDHKKILNTDAPKALYDTRIDPRSTFILQGTAPGYFSGNADVVDMPIYEKFYTAPWSVLSDADKRKRLEYGILDGTPFKDWNDERLISIYPDIAMAHGGRRQYDEQTIKNAAASGYAPTQEGAAQYERNKWGKNPRVYDAQTIANAAKSGYPATQSGAAEYELNNWQRKPSSGTKGSSKPKKEPNANTDIGYYMRTELGLDRKQTSYEERKKLAEKYGIKDYSGTGKQNMELLNRIKSEGDPKQSVLDILSGKKSDVDSKTITSGDAGTPINNTPAVTPTPPKPQKPKDGYYRTPIGTANNGVVVRVHDKNQRFIGWEDQDGNPIQIENPTGSPTSDFDPIYKPKKIIVPPGLAYGGEPDFDKPKVNFSSRTKSSDKNYLYKQTLYEDGSSEKTNRRTLKGFITGAAKPGEPGGPPKLGYGGFLHKAQNGEEVQPEYETVNVTDINDPAYQEYLYLKNLYDWSNLQDYDQRDVFKSPGYFYNGASDYINSPSDFTDLYEEFTNIYKDDGSPGLFIEPWNPESGGTNYQSDDLGVYGSKANRYNFATKEELDAWVRRNRSLSPGIYPAQSRDYYTDDINDWDQIMNKYQPIGYDAFIDWDDPQYGYRFDGNYDANKKRFIYQKPETVFLEDLIDRNAIKAIFPKLTNKEIDEYVAGERADPDYITNKIGPDNLNMWITNTGLPDNKDPNKKFPLTVKQAIYNSPEDKVNKYLTPEGTTGYLPEEIIDRPQRKQARYLPRFGTPESYLGKRYVYTDPKKTEPVATIAQPESKDNYYIQDSGNPGVSVLVHKLRNDDGTFTEKVMGPTLTRDWLNDEQQKEFYTTSGGQRQVDYNPDVNIYQDMNSAYKVINDERNAPRLEKEKQKQKEISDKIELEKQMLLTPKKIVAPKFQRGGDISVSDLRRVKINSLPKAQFGTPDWSEFITRKMTPAPTQNLVGDVRKANRPTAVAESTKPANAPKAHAEWKDKSGKQIIEEAKAQEAYDALPEELKRQDVLTADTRSDAEKFARRAWTAISQPMETIAAVNRGYDIPSGYMGMHDAYEGYGVGSPMTSVVDMAAGIPGFIANAAYRQGEKIVDSPGEYLLGQTLGLFDPKYRGEAVSNYLDLAAAVPAVKGLPRLPNKISNYTTNTGRQLSQIEREGLALGLSDFEIAQKQLSDVGITANQRKGYIPGVSELLNKYVTPFGYGSSYESKLAETFGNIKKGGWEAVRRGRPMNMKEASSVDMRSDAWRTYLGIPQKYNTFSMANTAPVMHPAYAPGSLKGMDIYNIPENKIFKSGFDDVTSTVGPRYSLRENGMGPLDKPILLDRDQNIMGGYNKVLTKDGLQYNDIWDLDPTINFESLVPGRVKKMMPEKWKEKLFYKDIPLSSAQHHPLHVSNNPFNNQPIIVTRPREMKIPVSKVIGKPFMSHGNLNYTSTMYVDDLAKEFQNELGQLAPEGLSGLLIDSPQYKQALDLQYKIDLLKSGQYPKYKNGGAAKRVKINTLPNNWKTK